MVKDSFVIPVETAREKIEVKKQHIAMEEVKPLRRKRSVKRKWFRYFILGFIVTVFWVVLIMSNHFYIMQLADQNYQMEKKLQEMNDELISYRAQLHSRTSFEPITKSAIHYLGMEMSNLPNVEIAVNRKESVP